MVCCAHATACAVLHRRLDAVCPRCACPQARAPRLGRRRHPGAHARAAPPGPGPRARRLWLRPLHQVGGPRSPRCLPSAGLHKLHMHCPPLPHAHLYLPTRLPCWCPAGVCSRPPPGSHPPVPCPAAPAAPPGMPSRWACSCSLPGLCPHLRWSWSGAARRAARPACLRARPPAPLCK